MDIFEILDEYLLAKPGAIKDFKEEWQWWRYLVGGKMFAARLCPSDKHDVAYAGKELLTLKCEPDLAQLLREKFPEIMPGFYMAKQNWNSIDLNGSLNEQQLKEMCDNSYELVFSKLTKKMQKEILETAK